MKNDSKKTSQTGPETWRVFCAVGLPADVRGHLAEHINRLREAVPNSQASWSRAENIHLTLKFLGETKTHRIEHLSNAAAQAVEGLSPFQISLEGNGVFPKRGLPRVLWIGVEDESGKLARLYSRLEEACVREGFRNEQRPFSPHLTLARLRQPQSAQHLAAAHNAIRFGPEQVTVSELLVIRSELSAEGSRYTVISRHALGRT
ncbi:MAG: RNA 2',3'-cyclic phosphodiesterase [Pyrinomonadaceae bacterium]